MCYWSYPQGSFILQAFFFSLECQCLRPRGVCTIVGFTFLSDVVHLIRIHPHFYLMRQRFVTKVCEVCKFIFISAPVRHMCVRCLHFQLLFYFSLCQTLSFQINALDRTVLHSFELPDQDFPPTFFLSATLQGCVQVCTYASPPFFVYFLSSPDFEMKLFSLFSACIW